MEMEPEDTSFEVDSDLEEHEASSSHRPSLWDLIQSTKKKDPKFDFYFPPNTTQAQRDIVFRAIMYFVSRPPRSTAPPYATVVGELSPAFTLNLNGDQLNPITVRFPSGKQIGNCLRFLDDHSNVIWNGGAPSGRIVMHISIENSAFFPFRH